MTRILFVFAMVLWVAGLARDTLDAWVDGVTLPPLLAEHSPQVLAADGTLLRAYTVDNGRWRLRVGLDGVDPRYIDMLVRYEDKRFWTHPGVDIMAMSRAVVQALRTGRVVSGGSTLTMQVARLLENSGTGAIEGKIRQIRVALALERELTKEQILSLYIDRAPFGGNVEGVRAAAFAWLGHPPARLTPAEAALLVAIPQAPESRRPDRRPDAAHRARDRVLARMARDGILSEDEARAAMTDPSPRARNPFPMLAPHLADAVRAAAPFQEAHHLTLDAGLQAQLQTLAADAVALGGDRLQIAILVADHTTGEIRASVGSAAYASDLRQGFVDMTTAPRSPGSTLKPLIYALAMDRGLIHPETLIEDRPIDFDGYRPQNFDGLFRGDVRVRQALQWSLNTPAVTVTQAMGVPHLMAGLRRTGAEPRLPDGQAGLAVVLGGLGLTLSDLVHVYAALANGGTQVDIRETSATSPGFAPRQIVGPVAAWQVADILRETPRPLGFAAPDIAYKTGTSYGHRDAWAVGFDGRHVVGVWMGRADGTPVPGAFGGELAAPVLFSAFERIGPATPLPPPPPETLLVAGADLPVPLQRFGAGPGADPDAPVIAFPPDGAMVEGLGLTARIRAGVPPYTWLANGAPMGQSHRPTFDFDDLGPGITRLTVIDALGRAARAEVELR